MGWYLSEAGVRADEALCWRAAVAIEPLLQGLLGLADPVQVQLIPQICQHNALQIHKAYPSAVISGALSWSVALAPSSLPDCEATPWEDLTQSRGQGSAEAQHDMPV